MPDTSKKISVELGDRSYDIVIGTSLLDQAGTYLAPLLQRPVTAIVTDENVIEAQGERLLGALSAANISAKTIILPPGEETKNFSNLEHLTNELLSFGIERADTIIAFGGGVIGDITGFAASVLRRGTGFIQIPTTLLAQVDSSVGGKTAINARLGKNLVGAFYQPKLVLADISTLSTLPFREVRAGLAEVIKYGLINNRTFFNWLVSNKEAILKLDPSLLSRAVEVSCQTKAAIVADDETEQSSRALLNLGHTFGHALEAETGYDGRLLHGEAVAIGMMLAFEFSASTGGCNPSDVEELKNALRGFGLPVSIDEIPAFKTDTASLMSHISQDKKVKGSELTFILATAVGQSHIANNIDPETLRAFLQTKV